MPPQDPADLLARYLLEIRATPLLSKADEHELGRRIEEGREAERWLASQPETGDALSAPELQARVAQGRAAAEELFRANLPLVVYVAKRYKRSGVPLLDVIQEGNLGLLRAVERFDHRRGVRFATYAIWWIRQAIRSGVARNSGPIQLPLRVRDRLALVQRVETRLTVELGRTPAPEELAQELGLSGREVEAAKAVPARVGSLAECVGDANLGSELSERIADERPGPEALAGAANELARLLGTLDERERQIVAMRYGLHGDHPRTLKQVGAVLGLTAERVRQLETRAISKLRQAASD